ncbi:MAG: hypothetical protein GXN99_02845 [Candidatus Nanohaloarchaeota archaeon]|nr:hypothetical protein [Candidatus Nanohaloarchaeota archaeon]
MPRKKALILTTHYHTLHYEEFVKPIVSIISKIAYEYDQISIFEQPPSHTYLQQYDAIIITGTSLQDMKYLDHLKKWKKPLSTFKNTIIGICAGMQVLASAHNIPLIKCKAVGVKKVKCLNKEFKVYDLHQYSVKRTADIEVLCSHKCIEGFKVKNTFHFGFAFHPEVFTPQLLENLLLLNKPTQPF